MKTDENNTLSRLSADVNNTTRDTDIIVGTVSGRRDDMNYPVRFDGLLIALVREGEGEISIDLEKYSVARDTLVIFHPRNYINYMQGNDVVVDVVACSTEVVENVLPKLTDLMPFLVHQRSAPVEYLDSEEADHLRQYMRFLKLQLDGPDTLFMRKKMICLLQAMLFEMMELYCVRNRVADSHRSRREELMAQFVLLVSEHFHEQRNVGYYAKRLGVSSKHLSAVIKQVSGRTAGVWIENYVIVEAKVLLGSTDMTVQQISQKLNFPNQSFFGKYFRHQTGMSPSEYRKSTS